MEESEQVQKGGQHTVEEKVIPGIDTIPSMFLETESIPRNSHTEQGLFRDRMEVG